MSIGNIFHSVETKLTGGMGKAVPVLDKVDNILGVAAPTVLQIVGGLAPQFAGPLAAIFKGIDFARNFADHKAASTGVAAAPAELNAAAVGHVTGVLNLNPEAIALLPALIQQGYEFLKAIKNFHDVRTGARS